jgi:hypothetical protein
MPGPHLRKPARESGRPQPDQGSKDKIAPRRQSEHALVVSTKAEGGVLVWVPPAAPTERLSRRRVRGSRRTRRLPPFPQEMRAWSLGQLAMQAGSEAGALVASLCTADPGVLEGVHDLPARAVRNCCQLTVLVFGGLAVRGRYAQASSRGNVFKDGQFLREVVFAGSYRRVFSMGRCPETGGSPQARLRGWRTTQQPRASSRSFSRLFPSGSHPRRCRRQGTTSVTGRVGYSCARAGTIGSAAGGTWSP